MSLKSEGGPDSPFLLQVEGGLSNYPRWVEKCLEAAPFVTPTEYARFLSKLMRTNTRLGRSSCTRTT